MGFAHVCLKAHDPPRGSLDADTRQFIAHDEPAAWLERFEGSPRRPLSI